MAQLLLALVLAVHLAGAGRRLLALPMCRYLPTRAMQAPLAFGFLTGISVCPPFLLALAAALSAGGSLEGMILFAAFFAGTSIYLLPLVPFGLLGRWESPRLIGRMAGALSAGLFALLGLQRVLVG